MATQCELVWTFQEGVFRTFQLNIVLLKCYYSDLVKLMFNWIVLVGVKAYLKPLKLYFNHCFNLIKKTILNGIVIKTWGIRFKCYEPWLYKHNFTEKCSHLLFTNLWIIRHRVIIREPILLENLFNFGKLLSWI